jgi:FkbM family methyltransferase
MTKVGRFVRRILAFPKKSSQEKLSSYVSRWTRWFPGTPPPIRLPVGAWWLLDRDYLGECLLHCGYENEERMFVDRFLRSGMTVIDIGAHRGFYTLLFSRKLRNCGRVIAFEPSVTESNRLKLHLRINLCRNVEVKDCALGKETGKASLYVVHSETVLNSLRTPDTRHASSSVPVQVHRLDDVLSSERITKVDFVKLDVEGGELDVLLGAECLLRCVPRPVILCEVLEKRTRPWGYSSRLIIDHLVQRDFIWFQLNATADLLPVEVDALEFSGNFIAVPRESLHTIEHLRAPVKNCLSTVISRNERP